MFFASKSQTNFHFNTTIPAAVEHNYSLFLVSIMLHVSVLLTVHAYKYISKTQVYLQVEYISWPVDGPEKH
jgi:hypothetical protein